MRAQREESNRQMAETRGRSGFSTCYELRAIGR